MYSKDKNYLIGKYLKSAVCQKCTNITEFCKQYIRLASGTNNDDPDPDELQREKNKMSQIFNGSKSVQIEDLPYYSEILGVDIAEILSAGEYTTYKTSRPTNFSIALSDSEKDWEDYINSEKRQVLYEDEFGKTLIDYALEFNNYRLLKYLTMNGHIVWYDDNEILNGLNFNERTSFTDLKNITSSDYIDPDELNIERRKELIYLSIANNDINMLSKLYAREYCFFDELLCGYPEFTDKLFETNFDQNLIDYILKAGNSEVMKYFYESFYSSCVNGPRSVSERNVLMVFPYINNLVDAAIRNSHADTIYMLKSLSAHNNRILSAIKKELYENIENLAANLWYYKEKLPEAVKEHIKLYRNLNIYSNKPLIYSYPNNQNWSAFLVVRLDVETDNKELTELIAEINSISYEISEFNSEIDELTDTYFSEKFELVEETI